MHAPEEAAHAVANEAEVDEKLRHPVAVVRRARPQPLFPLGIGLSKN